MDRDPDISCVDATERALAAATHLTPMDDGAVEATRKLARKIDAWDVIVQWALDDVAGKRGMEGRPVVPEHDNVTIPTYLKYCDALGLTPAGRDKLKDLGGKGKPGGKLASLRSIEGGRKRA
jgi:hypothetical protein